MLTELSILMQKFPRWVNIWIDSLFLLAFPASIFSISKLAKYSRNF